MSDHKGTRAVLVGKTDKAYHLDTSEALALASKLKGKTVIITGAGSGIGKEFAIAAGKLGANVVLAGRRAEVLEEAAKEVREAGGQALAKPTDVDEWDQLAALFEAAVEKFKVVDCVVANAGRLETQTIFYEDGPGVKPTKPNTDCISTNLIGAIYTMKLAFHYLKRNPSQDARSLIFVSSVAALHGFAALQTYTAAKHGINGLQKSSFWDAQAHGITINTVCPWFTMTPILTPLLLQVIEGLPFAKNEDVTTALIKCATDKTWNGKTLSVDQDGILVVDHPSNYDDPDHDAHYGEVTRRTVPGLVPLPIEASHL